MTSVETYARHFAGTPQAVSEAREWVGMVLTCPHPDARPPDATTATAQLLTSELATNAVVHTASGQGGKFIVTVCLARSSGVVRVVVTDDGHTTHTPHVHAVDPDAETGRGLNLVNAFAHEWGSDAAAGDGPGHVFFVLCWPDPPPARDAGAVPAEEAPR